MQLNILEGLLEKKHDIMTGNCGLLQMKSGQSLLSKYCLLCCLCLFTNPELCVFCLGGGKAYQHDVIWLQMDYNSHNNRFMAELRYSLCGSLS